MHGGPRDVRLTPRRSTRASACATLAALRVVEVTQALWNGREYADTFAARVRQRPARRGGRPGGGREDCASRLRPRTRKAAKVLGMSVFAERRP